MEFMNVIVTVLNFNMIKKRERDKSLVRCFVCKSGLNRLCQATINVKAG